MVEGKNHYKKVVSDEKPCQPSPPVHRAQIPIRAADLGAYVLLDVRYYQFSTSIVVTDTSEYNASTKLVLLAAHELVGKLPPHPISLLNIMFLSVSDCISSPVLVSELALRNCIPFPIALPPQCLNQNVRTA